MGMRVCVCVSVGGYECVWGAGVRVRGLCMCVDVSVGM